MRQTQIRQTRMFCLIWGLNYRNLCWMWFSLQAYVESKSPRNPFKQRKKPCDELVAHQLKLFTLILGVGEKKARTLLDHFGHPQGLASVPEDMLIAKLTPLIGESSAQNVYDFFYTKIGFTRTWKPHVICTSHYVYKQLHMFFFTFVWPCIITDFFVIKPTRCTNFTNLFCHEILRVSDSSSVHHQEFIHCTLSSGICRTGL